MPVHIPAILKSRLRAKINDIAVIDVHYYHAANHLKSAQVFLLSMIDIQYQGEKEARVNIDPKNVVSQQYHNFVNVFSKKDFNTLTSYENYDHKIQLYRKLKSSQALLYKISLNKLDVVE